MRGGRKNLKRATVEDNVTLEDGQAIMQVISLRGSNLIEVMDACGAKSLALFPAKFQKSMWIKRGLSYGALLWLMKVERKRLLNQVARLHVLFLEFFFTNKFEHFRSLWNAISKLQNEIGKTDDDDDGLPPLEANMNRMRPLESQANEDSDSNSDADASVI